MPRKPLRHGSTFIVNSPDAKHNRKDRDFGMGFYTTTDLEMAKNWAITKMKIHNVSEGYINEYETVEFPENFKVLKFDKMNEKWLDFVYNNRRVLSFEHDYDVVIGPTADLKVGQVLNDYETGWMSKEETLKELSKCPIGIQILFHTERAVELLKLKRIITIDDYGNIKKGTRSAKQRKR